MKKRNIYQLLFIALVCLLTSCNDWFQVAPKSETTIEDYWTDENDVKSMVGACYRAMNEGGFMDRLLVWGEVRSDNVRRGAAAGEERNRDVTRILDLTLNASNPFAKWEDFYRVINYCNTVIELAPGAREKDPNFTEGQLRAYLAEAKGIRALCYFILTRTFRDIPFPTQPTIDDTQTLSLPQVDPDEIINYLIADLKSVENSAIIEYENLASDKGRITRKAIWALIADMSLWMNDYVTCVEYCDKILNLQTAALKHPLMLEKIPQTYFTNIFVNGNSTESIFELQFDPSLLKGSTTVHSMYCRMNYTGGGYMSGDDNNERVATFDFVEKIPLFLRDADLRSKDFYIQKGSNERYPIIKYVGDRFHTKERPVAGDYFTTPFHSWIFYRLPDIYLMKAEALVESGGDLDEALKCVSKSYDRANPDLNEGSLPLRSREAMRQLVFEERQREFLFEGKRYFDLLRRVKRENSISVAVEYLLKKYDHLNQATVRSKLGDRDALYMPIHEDELKSNSLLKQNPFYVLSSEITKK